MLQSNLIIMKIKPHWFTAVLKDLPMTVRLTETEHLNHNENEATLIYTITAVLKDLLITVRLTTCCRANNEHEATLVYEPADDTETDHMLPSNAIIMKMKPHRFTAVLKDLPMTASACTHHML